MVTENEDRELRSAALENARSILAARERTQRELMEVQDALRELNERLQIALEAGKLGTWNWDAATDQLVLGTRAAEVAGLAENVPYTREQIRRRLPPEDAQRAREALDKALTERTDYACEYRVNRPDGSQRWVAASGRGVYADDGTVLGMTGVMQDITKKKREEQALREADARKDEFLATLAHELRNPLAPLRSSLEILGRENIGPEAQEAARMVMLRQVNQMVALIDDLIDISRISTGRIDLNREPVALAAVVEIALEISRPLIEARGHSFSLYLGEAPIHIEADRTRIAQAISNLLNNAAKYANQNGSIRLSATLEGDYVVVTVADSGIGIEPEMLSRVFEMFVQVDSRLERVEGGLGVGLTLARRLAELHGGTLEARSGGLGQGSEFILRLKAIPAPAAHAPGARHEVAREPGRRRVVVVDDNVDHAESVATLLRLEGHEVHTAYNGLEAIDAVAAVHPEVVLLDIGMPGMNGYETARRIRAGHGGAEMKLIALSGWGQPRDRERSEQSGFDHHLVKPVEPAVLQRTIIDESRGRASGEGRLRVLLVDDNADLRASLASILQLSGCDMEIRTVPDGAAAVAAALEWGPRVAFIDIHMPGMNGFQVARKLRERFLPGSMKLILMSGVTIDETLARDAKQAGFDACIDKVAEPDLWLRHLEPGVAA